jgi:hypothetical protein
MTTRSAFSTITLFLVLLHAACMERGKEVQLDEFADAVAMQASSQEPSDLLLADFTAFEWDRVFVFPPYTPYEEIRDTIQAPWDSVSKTGIAQRDDATLLVFMKGGEIVRFAMYPRAKGDLSELSLPHGLSPKQARFVPHRVDRGGPWIVVQVVPANE